MQSGSTSFDTLSLEDQNAKLKEVGLLLKAHDLSEVQPKVID
jgi:hypothetical protein